MHFTKMQGIGNDYVYVDGSRERISDPSAAAVRISDRHFGIGSDGLIMINPSSCADFAMDMYNADGSRGKMCGNGIRCVGKYVYDHGLTQKKSLRIETLSGIRTLDLNTGEDGKVTSVRVDMGEPVLDPKLIPVLAAGLPENTGRIVAYPRMIGNSHYEITCVSMGNPHCVIFCAKDISDLPLSETGPLFEHDPFFPEQVNTEFVNVLGRDHVRMRVWERGSGETWACGTGACAVGVACVLNGLTDRALTVSLTGGDLFIEWEADSNRVFMTGPAAEVFEGDISL